MDPGAYCPKRARLNNGLCLCSNSCLKFFVLFLPVKLFGLKVGEETNESISPVEGSIATMLPILFCSRFSPYLCKFASIVVVTFNPATALVSYLP